MSVPLPADTSLAQSFEWGLDINLGTPGAPSWQPVRRMSAWAPTYTPTEIDAATYDDLGSENMEATGLTFGAALTVQGNQSETTGLYLPELESILAAARSFGAARQREFRWYNKPAAGTPNPNGAGKALCNVTATRQNTGNAEIETYSVTLAGKGPFTPIANPFAGWDVTAPTLAGITPADAAEGDLVSLTGTGFLGATAVAFDSTVLTAEDFVVANGATIIAQMPAGAAGEVDVTVTTPGGTSAALVYTRGA